MNMKVLSILAFCFSTCCAAFGATRAKGDCMANPIAITPGQSATVRLVDEYDVDLKENLGSGVAIYRMALKKGQAYTVWITGGATSELMLDVGSDWTKDTAAWAAFDYETFAGGSTMAAFLYSDSWDEEDPNADYFYITISGDIGQSCNLYTSQGIMTFNVEGEESSPKVLNITDTMQRAEQNFIDGEYYFSARLEAGRKYMFHTVGGTSSNQYVMDFDGDDFEQLIDPAYSNDNNNASWLLYPQSTMTYTIHVMGDSGNFGRFKLKYQAFPARKPSNHPVKDLNSSNGYSSEISPGRVAADHNYYDDVIDETLCRIPVKKGERWLFQTEGAVGDVLMRVYASDGTLLRENDGTGNGSLETRCAVEAPKNGNLYVGVCDAMLTYDNAPESTLPNLLLSAYRAEDFGVRDAWDEAGDDDINTSNLIIPQPVPDDVEVIDPLLYGQMHGGHTLSGSDWYDFFGFAARKGVTYAFKTTFETSAAVSNLLLNARVYKVVDGAAVRWSGTSAGDLTPAVANYGIDSSFKFTADEDGMFYLRISCSKGFGLDYPQYALYSCCYKEGTSLGLLRVKTMGTDATWYLKGSTARYANGAVVALPVAETNKVKFTDVGAPFSYPSPVTTNVVAWTGDESSITEIVGFYKDTYDPADDVMEGFVTLTPVNTEHKASRTLWQDDAADYFLFRAIEGIYYNFWLEDTTADGSGDACMDVIRRVNGETLAEGVAEYRKQSYPAGKYYVKVRHEENPAVGSSYRLHYSCANVGTVQFAETAFRVNDDANFVDLTVTRTASDGRVRVHYATIGGTAVPGKEYYPTNGVLEWADGDMAPKTVRVRLIPDLTPEYEGIERFYVKLWPMEGDALGEDEYFTTIPEGGDLAEVKVKESKALKPGKIKFRGPYTVTADETLQFGIGRTGGADGRVAVLVKILPDTAVAGVDYIRVDTNIVWEAGEQCDKFVSVETIGSGSLESKQFKVKISVLNTGDYADCQTPTLAEEKALVTIESEVVGATLGDVAAKAATAGVALTNTKVWFEDSTSAFRSAPIAEGATGKAKFSVTGPGFFVAVPQVKGGEATLTCSGSDKGTFVCTSGDKLVLPVASTDPVTIEFKINNSDGDAYCEFETQDNGLPFKWLPLTSVTPVEPRNGAVVESSQASFAWAEPTGKTAEGLWYRVRLGNTSAKTSKITTVVTPGTVAPNCLYGGAALTAGKQYWWMVDYAYSDADDPDFDELDWLTGPAIWSFTVKASRAPTTVVRDVYGQPVENQPAGIPVELVQGVYARYNFAAESGAASSVSLVSGSLPTGLNLRDTGLKFFGVPSRVYINKKTAVFGVKDAASRLGSTVAMVFTIKELGVGAGSFSGALLEDGNALTNGFPRVGKLNFTAGTDGVLSATAFIAGRKYKFSSTRGYDEANDEHTRAQVALEHVETISDVVYTNRLEISSRIGSATNLVELGQVISQAKLTVNIPDASMLGVQRDIVYVCDLYRDNRACADYVAALAGYTGYYTVSLVPFGVQALDGVPCGNGYLTLTIAANGTATYAGRLADGTEVSGSSVAQLVGDLSDPSTCELCVPIALRADPYSFGGVLKIKNGVVDSLSELEWNKDGPTSSFDRMGYRIAIRPTGGWYNTTYNLQTYYLNRDFTIEADPVDGLPSGMLPVGGAYTAQTMPNGVGLKLAGNTMAPDARVWAYEEGSDVRYDFAKSVNPWFVKTSFVRETGLVTGTFKAWTDDGSTQSLLTSVNHYGILLMNRDAYTPLDTDVWTAGFYLLPVNSKWTLSLPFNIRSTTVDRDWSEVEIPVAE